jgi:uncharacterized damage-inducible protein DinB
VTTKADLLEIWDQQTAKLDQVFAQIPAHRFSEVDKAFGQWENRGIDTIRYAIDNEIHHRGQGYVYLRALGIEPPPFWERWGEVLSFQLSVVSEIRTLKTDN